MKSREPQKLKQLFFISILSVSPLIFLLALELIFWMAGIGYDTRILISPPGLPNYLVTNPDYVSKFSARIEASTKDQTGSTLIPRIKAPGTKRIFILGESTPQGFPFYPNQAFGPAAGRIIEAQTNTKIETINLSATATTSMFVADLAPRLLEFQPDALVVYGGHNEYYGMLASPDNDSDISSKIYLWLKQFRVFQLIFHQITQPLPESHTLMEKQFAGKEFPLDPVRDSRVNARFVKNYLMAYEPYLKANIPVIIFEPVSNIINIAPFKQGGNISWKPELTEIELFRIKDEDSIPFRAREGLIQAMRKSFSDMAGITLIPTKQLLKETTNKNLGTDLFLEHVHFSAFGHRAMAQILSKFLLKDLFANFTDKSNSDTVVDPLLLTELTEAKALKTLEILLSHPPFVNISPKYQPDISLWLSDNRFFVDSQFWEEFKPQNYYSQGISFLKQHGQNTDILKELKNNIIIFPAFPTYYEEMATILKADNQPEIADKMLQFAESVLIKQ